MFGTCEVLYWMKTEHVDWEATMSKFLGGTNIGVPAIAKAIKPSSHPNVCQRRPWSLVEGSQRKVADLPAICSMLDRFPKTHHSRHENCTADSCLFDDDNTTMVAQQHKCHEGKENPCETKVFDPRKINDVIKPGLFQSTAWLIQGQTNLESQLASGPNPPPYMAISHVWIDGTGKGKNGFGEVNKYLFEFFTRYAKIINCDII